MGNKIGDIPTVELGREELARYAREVDERAKQTEAIPERVTRRPGQTNPDLEIDIEVGDVELESGALDELESDGLLGATEPEAPAWPAPTSVPFLVASREDLSWFELEEVTRLVLGRIDGIATVVVIVSALTLPPERSLAALRELHAHGVIDFS